MNVLIAEMACLLVATTLIAIAVDRWRMRRRRVKVKFDYARLLQVGIKPRESVSPAVRSQAALGQSESPGIPMPHRLPPLDSRPAPVAPVDVALRDELAQVHRRVDELADAVSALHIISDPLPTRLSVDLRPLLERIEALEREARSQRDTPDRGTFVPRVVPVSVDVTRVIRGNEWRSAPSEAMPDDLKRIKGVKSGMERMLRDIRIRYFWQIAAWSPEEVRQAETRVRQFRGRIERDEWVAQAARLMREPDAASRPNALRE